ncbi:putative sugar/inositol transporter, major facilitator, sugar transporter [Dioscorea sansibarensis]
MAITMIVQNSQGKDYHGKITLFVLLVSVVASTGGLIFGYDIGISGGVTAMDSFLLKFFPSVSTKEKLSHNTNLYCKFNSQLLTLFTTSFYLAALVASFFASGMTKGFGRKWSMFSGGIIFFIGSIINGTAMNIFMLILGRLLLGVGVGFIIQSVPLYLSEMAPPHHRGMLNIGFQLMVTVGILFANIVNYGTTKIKGGWGWRVSLGLAIIPACIFTLGSLFLPDTPNSLIERGEEEKAKIVLQKIRGTNDVKIEFDYMRAASKEANIINHSMFNILNRKYRPQLTMAIFIPFFQQLTGINVIMFYAPVLFKTIGFQDNASFVSAIITGLVNVFATLVSISTVDKFGRKVLFLQGGTHMFICQILVGTFIGLVFGTHGEGGIPKQYAISVVLLICFYVSGFAWSWGPLGWLVPSEIFPIEVRSIGQSITVSMNMFFTFIIAQVFLSMLCHMKFYLFFFFAGWLVIMTIFVGVFLPETKNVPMDEMVFVWKHHWFWGRFVNDDDVRFGYFRVTK